MPFYKVLVQEVHISTRIIEADDIHEAEVDGLGGEEVACEYSHTPDDDDAVEVEGPLDDDDGDLIEWKKRQEKKDG